MADLPQTKRVLACGVFDVFHAGHLRYLRYARSQGASLTVAVVRDREALLAKGRQPQLDEQHRLEVVAAMGCVDRAVLQPRSLADVAAALEWIPSLGVNHLVLGGMWADVPERAALAALLRDRDITTEFAPVTQGISTTLLLNSIRDEEALRFGEMPVPGRAVAHASPAADVLALGVFDLLHPGHVRYLEFASAQGQRLAVAVCPDALCLALKMKIPVMQASHRIELVSSLRCVGHAAQMPCGTEESERAADWIVAWGTRKLVVGAAMAQTPRMLKLSQLLGRNGIQVMAVPPYAGVSTSIIAQRIRSA